MKHIARKRFNNSGVRAVEFLQILGYGSYHGRDTTRIMKNEKGISCLRELFSSYLVALRLCFLSQSCTFEAVLNLIPQ